MTTPTHKLATRRIRLDRLHPYHANPRRGNVAAIAESLATVGQYKPIVVNAGTLTGRPLEVLAGNHTLAAASQLGWSSLLCVTVDVGEEEAARIVAADNRTADLGSYDDAELLALLEGLPDLAGTGYADSDLAELAAATRSPVSLTDPDEAPSLEETPVVAAAGDVWQLGPHRLAVGNAADLGVLEKAMGDEPGRVNAHCLWTDPPYGVDYTGKTADALKLTGDTRDAETLGALLEATLGTAIDHALRPGAAIYVAAPAGPQTLVFAQTLTALGAWRQTLVWVKDSMVLGHSDYHYRHEYVYAGYAPGGKGRMGRGGDGWFGDNSQTTVFEIPRPKRSAEHPTMKPVELIEPMLTNSTRAGDLVLDLFAGSGSTLIACHQTGRIARLVELDPRYADVIDPRYADVICRRWQAHTGEPPTRGGVPVDFLEGAA
jgi:DNA modification methylase